MTVVADEWSSTTEPGLSTGSLNEAPQRFRAAGLFIAGLAIALFCDVNDHRAVSHKPIVISPGIFVVLRICPIFTLNDITISQIYRVLALPASKTGQSLELVRRAYSEIDLGQLHYRMAGNPSSPCLVLLHQSPSGSIMYESVMKVLEGDFYLLAPDLPGFGQTAALLETVTIPGYAAVVEDWLSCLGIASCAVFGHHTGAAVAVDLAVKEPGRILRLALSGPPLLSAESKKSLPQRAALTPLVEDGAHLQSMWQRFRAKDPQASLVLSQRELISALDCGNGYPDSYAAVAAYDLAGALRSVLCKTLVFASPEDVLQPSVAPALALLKQGETTTVHGGGPSYLCDREANQLGDILRTFLTSESKK